MQKELASMVFDLLSRRIGENVSCKVWHLGELIEYEGILEEVIPFDRVTVGKNIIPFVGTGIAIEEITLAGKDNHIIYTNPKAKDYNTKDLFGVIQEQESMLGYSVNMNGLQERTERKIR